jgi:hypothetical protein
MRSDRLEVSVSFDPERGYIGSAPELQQPVTALSLGGLRRRIEALLLPDDVDVRLQLDRSARLEHDRRLVSDRWAPIVCAACRQCGFFSGVERRRRGDYCLPNHCPKLPDTKRASKTLC